MRKILISLALLAASALPGFSQTSDLQELSSGIDARGWEAVGRLDIAGKGFCTGALIAPDIVLTAAHCMYNKAEGAPVRPDAIEFFAGLRNGRAEATRIARSYVVHPSYTHSDNAEPESVRNDLALVILERPIQSTGIRSLDVSESSRGGTEIGVVSYSEGQSEVPSLQQVCNVLGEQDGVLIMDCAVDFGASGSPVFRFENGVPRLVSVVSAMADLDGEKVALGPDLAQPLPFLLTLISEDTNGFIAAGDGRPTSARVIRSGERSDTGALFVRP